MLAFECYVTHMKKMTCKELGGACDAIITGGTPEEMGENCKKHVMELKMKGDTSHDEAMQAMINKTPEQFQEFMTDFRKRFEEAEEV